MSGRPGLQPIHVAPQVAGSEDAALVAAVRAGDERAFERLFLSYFDALCVFAYGYLRSRETAEEVVQDVLCRIWEQRATWTVQETLSHFLYGAVRNRSLNALAHGKVVARAERRAEENHAAIGMGAGPAPTDERVRANEVAEAFERALAQLPERTRQVVLLRLRNRLSVAEVAQIMGITPKGVEFHITRGLRELRTELAAFF